MDKKKIYRVKDPLNIKMEKKFDENDECPGTVWGGKKLEDVLDCPCKRRKNRISSNSILLMGGYYPDAELTGREKKIPDHLVPMKGLIRATQRREGGCRRN